MARYFAGNSLAAFGRTSTNIVETTSGGTFDSAYVSNSIDLGTVSGEYAYSAPFSATGTVHVRFDLMIVGSSATNNGPTLMNGSTGVFRMIRTGNLSFQAQYWNGSAWTNTGSAFSVAAVGLYQFNLVVVLGSSFEIYRDKVNLVASGSGWSGGGTTVTEFRSYCQSTGGTSTKISQVMIADYDLRESKFMSAAINGDGTYTNGTGTYADVDETALNDADAITLSTAGDHRGFTKASITVPTGFIIAAMVANARGRISSPVTDGKIGVLSSGVTSLSSGRSYQAIYGPGCYILDSDPNTATNFTQTGFNNAEVYVEAA